MQDPSDLLIGVEYLGILGILGAFGRQDCDLPIADRDNTGASQAITPVTSR